MFSFGGICICSFCQIFSINCSRMILINSVIFQCMNVLVSHRIFKHCLDLLTNEQSTRIIFNSLEGNYALCLLGKSINFRSIFFTLWDFYTKISKWSPLYTYILSITEHDNLIGFSIFITLCHWNKWYKPLYYQLSF